MPTPKGINKADPAKTTGNSQGKEIRGGKKLTCKKAKARKANTIALFFMRQVRNDKQGMFFMKIEEQLNFPALES